MTSLDIVNCEIGTISSRQDHSCKFTVVTPELRVSESGELMQWHGRACRVIIKPHEGEADAAIQITTERDTKTPSQRIRAVLFLVWKQEGQQGTFDSFYSNYCEKIITHLKSKLNDQ